MLIEHFISEMTDLRTAKTANKNMQQTREEHDRCSKENDLRLRIQQAAQRRFEQCKISAA